MAAILLLPEDERRKPKQPNNDWVWFVVLAFIVMAMLAQCSG